MKKRGSYGGNVRHARKPRPENKLGCQVYHLVYDFGELSYEESVVAASSPDRATELLAQRLFQNFLGEEAAETTDFLV